MKCIPIILMSMAIASCSSKMHVSKYAKYGKQESGGLYTYYNDSLKFSMDFFGNHTLQSLSKSRPLLPKGNKKLLLRYGIKSKLSFLFKYKMTVRGFGNDCYCYILNGNKLLIDSAAFIFSNTTNNSFYSKQLVSDSENIYLVSGCVVNNDILIFINATPRIQIVYQDLQNVVADEIATIKNATVYKQFNTGRQKLEKIINEATFDEVNYIKNKNTLAAIPLDTVDKYHLDNIYFQALITKISFLDNLNETRSYYQKYSDYLKQGETVKSKKVPLNFTKDAIKEVENISKTQKMIMINESHYDYRHRLFVNLLLDSLYNNGYRYLCLEDKETGIQPDSVYVSQEDGFYISEPFMGSLVRKAKQLGFTIYGYDDGNTSNITQREIKQGENLYNLYKKDTVNKWLVLGGYAHVNKKGFDSYHKSAWQRFSALAGFNPYSINQSDFSDILNEDYSFKNDSIGYYSLNGDTTKVELQQSDLYIVNNIKEHPYEHPFSSIEDKLTAYTFENNETTFKNPYLFVYIKQEYLSLNIHAIPVYIGEVNLLKTKKLFLPKDGYVGFFVNDDEEISKPFDLHPL